MAKLLERPATYADLQKVPEHLVAELIDGELFTSPRPAMRRAHPNKRLASLLERAFEDGIDGPGGWWIYPEVELHLGADVFVPDISGWRREHLPAIPDAAGIDIAPDWVCEILSPSTHRLDRLKKLPKYARNGIRHVWIVDPEHRTLEVCCRNGNAYETVQIFDAHDEPIVRAEPFEAVEFPLESLWLPTAPSPRN
jgi:Uma2 family endonuclease